MSEILPVKLIRWEANNSDPVVIWKGVIGGIQFGDSYPRWIAPGYTATTISFDNDINIERKDDMLYLSKKAEVK